MVEQAIILVTRNELPVKDLKEFAAYTKANQAKMQYGSAGAGSGSHLACAQLNAALGVEVTHVPYRGSPPAMQDLIAGRIDYFCALAAAAMPQINSNSMRAVAILTRNRSPLLPNLASAHEQGLTDFNSYFWSGFFLPKGMPAAIVQKLHAAAVATLDTPSTQERLKEVGVTVVGRRPPLTGLSQTLPQWRDREMGGDDQGKRREPGLSRQPDYFGPSPGMIPDGSV